MVKRWGLRLMLMEAGIGKSPVIWRVTKGVSLPRVAGVLRGKGGLTLPISRSLVSMTMMVELCSHSMRQKSSVLSARGPCVAM